MFLCFQRGTLNFHQNNDQIQDKKAIANKIKNQSLLSKNFLQIKEEIKLNVDDLVKTYQLFDELMCATNSHSTLKKYFWQVRHKSILNSKQRSIFDFDYSIIESRFLHTNCQSNDPLFAKEPS